MSRSGTYIRASYALSRYATVFQNQVYAIPSVARMEAVMQCRERSVFIYSDSLTAHKAIWNTQKKTSLQVLE